MNKMDSLGYKGLEEFQKYYVGIFANYQRYGNIVLEKDLEEYEGEIKDVFSKSSELNDIVQNLTSFWKNKYQVVINSCEDVAKVYKIIKDTNANRMGIPKIEIYIGDGSGTKLFYISKRFYEKCMNSKNDYIFYNNCIYEIKHDYYHGNYIIIKNEIIIEEALKD